MGANVGRLGKLMKGTSVVALVQNFSIDMRSDWLETTSLQDNAKKYVSGLHEYTGRAEFFFDPSDTNQLAIHNAMINGTKLTDIKFYIDNTHYYSGDLWITGQSVSVPVGDIIRLSCDFRFDGTLNFS